MLITKDMVGKTVYCLNSQPRRNYHPAKLERVVTKVGRKYIYIDDEQYEPRGDLSTDEFTYLYGSFGSSITVFNSKQLYDDHNETELQKKLVDFSKDRLGIYNIPLDDLKLVPVLGGVTGHCILGKRSRAKIQYRTYKYHGESVQYS